jgi:tetratricopeptide (TPR) repeat protein
MDVMAGEGGPYVGRRPFSADDRGLFFGRSHEIRQVEKVWRDRPLTVLHGPAGSGKTSILQAGVIPALYGHVDVLPLGRTLVGSSFPEPLLPHHNPYVLSVLSGWSPAEDRTRLARQSLTDFLRRRSSDRARLGPAAALLVAIDQLEEIFAGDRGKMHRDNLFKDLAAAMREMPWLRVLLATRTDTLGDLVPFEAALSQRDTAHIALPALTPSAALEAVRGPLEGTVRPFAADVAEYLVEQLRTAEGMGDVHETAYGIAGKVEPVQIQLVCNSLWQAVSSNASAITFALVRDNVDVDRILAEFCADAVFEVSAQHHISALRLFGWMERACVASDGSPVGVTDAPTVGNISSSVILRALENLHLMVGYQNVGTKWYRLASGRLAEAVRYLSAPASLTVKPRTNLARHLSLAESAWTEGDLTLAERKAAEVLENADPEDLHLQAEARTVLGNIAYQLGRLELAERHYRLAAELHEQLGAQDAVGRLFGAIGSMHAREGRYLAALDELQAAVTRLPRDLTLQTELAVALWHAGQSQAASAVFGTVLAVEPDSTDALAGRGQIRAERGNASAALEDLQELQRLRPSASLQPEVRSAYALALAGLGKSETAMAEANAAMATANDSGFIFLRAAQVARSGGATELATELLLRAEQAAHPPLTSHQLDQVRRLRGKSHPVPAGSSDSHA